MKTIKKKTIKQFYDIIKWCFSFINLLFTISEKYTIVGRLLKPGEEPASYSDEENETDTSKDTSSAKPKAE